MKHSSGMINISESTKRLHVDNRIPLRYYYRIANNLLRQADIYRSEKNIIDLFVMLLRFSRLLNALDELEALKPDVQHRLEELNRKNGNQVNRWAQVPQYGFLDDSFEWLLVKKQMPNNNKTSEAHKMVARDGFYRIPNVQGEKLLINAKEYQFHKLSLSIPRPKEETLSRHSILGPNGLHGRWQLPNVNQGIQYPSNLDLTPVEIPRLFKGMISTWARRSRMMRFRCLLQPTEDKPVTVKENGTSENKRSILEVLSLQDDSTQVHEESRPMINLDDSDVNPKMEIIREVSPPPVLAEVQDVAVTAHYSNSSTAQTISLQDELIHAESPQEVHISTALMDSFMRLAKSNTVRNLETCGVLAGFLKNRKFYVTALIIPKQESPSDSTHPTQSCFMSSIDLHTHYSYQIMLPEAIAIVMAPKDGSRNHDIFRLTAPGGMSVIRHCQQRGFHPHQQPPDGGRI